MDFASITQGWPQVTFMMYCAETSGPTTSFIRPKRAEQDTPDLEMGTSSSTTPEEAGMQ